MCILAAVLNLWMCYYVHKHNTSHKSAVREGLEYEGVVGGVGDDRNLSRRLGEGYEYEQVGGGKGERSYLHGGWRRRRERGEHFPTQGKGSLQAEYLAAQTNLIYKLASRSLHSQLYGVLEVLKQRA